MPRTSGTLFRLRRMKQARIPPRWRSRGMSGWKPGNAGRRGAQCRTCCRCVHRPIAPRLHSCGSRECSPPAPRRASPDADRHRRPGCRWSTRTSRRQWRPALPAYRNCRKSMVRCRNRIGCSFPAVYESISRVTAYFSEYGGSIGYNSTNHSFRSSVNGGRIPIPTDFIACPLGCIVPGFTNPLLDIKLTQHGTTMRQTVSVP